MQVCANALTNYSGMEHLTAIPGTEREAAQGRTQTIETARKEEKPPLLRKLLFHAVIFLVGMLSMGFQIVASRELAPSFGSSIIVWSFLISTFLIAFSAGSFIGGAIAARSGRQKTSACWVLTAFAVAGFAINAFLRIPILELIETHIESLYLGICAACVTLFLLPVLALTSLTPLCVQFYSRSTADGSSGHAAGMIYGVSTLGNIAGVMITALFLVPRLPVSSILVLWTVFALVILSSLCLLVRSR